MKYRPNVCGHIKSVSQGFQEEDITYCVCDPCMPTENIMSVTVPEEKMEVNQVISDIAIRVSCKFEMFSLNWL